MNALPDMPALPGQKKIRIGRDAGWILSFHQITRGGIAEDPVFEMSRDDYYAEITASLPSGLEGGSYSFVIEGMTDADYKQITQTAPDAPSIVRLYLYWRDLANSDLGIATNVLGGDFINGFQKTSKIAKHAQDLVAELRIVSVSRKAGSRKYEVTITACELVFELLQKSYPRGDSIELNKPYAAAKELLRRAWPFPEGEVPFIYHEISPRADAPAPSEDDQTKQFVDARRPAAVALQDIASQLEQTANRYGRGMLLIRDGTLHVGQRPVPFDEANPAPTQLTLDQGLLETEVAGKEARDPNWDPADHPEEQPPQRVQYRLTLRGRPDIKPGDVVEFEAPPEEDTNTTSPLGGAFGAAGDLVASVVELFQSPAGNKVQLYVASVEHRVGREGGFTTTVVGAQVGKGGDLDMDEVWDAHTARAESSAPGERTVRGTVEQDAADAVVRLIRREIARLGSTDIGEIRDFLPISSDANPGQTSKLFCGLMPIGGPGPSRRADIKRPSDSEAHGVPYLTPFAWGKTGLVLPRYPGMRVALTHNRFDQSDPIDLGAIWQTGHGPVEAEDGDWWLSLPADNPTGNEPGDKTTGSPEDYSGTCSNDLIDSNGNRVIEVGALIVRVGKQDLRAAGGRPDKPKEAEKDSVTIESTSESATWKLQIKQNGEITLQGKAITLKATDTLTLDAPKVQVQCDSMDVGDRQ
jgi:hypothetical protein